MSLERQFLCFLAGNFLAGEVPAEFHFLLRGDRGDAWRPLLSYMGAVAPGTLRYFTQHTGLVVRQQRLLDMWREVLRLVNARDRARREGDLATLHRLETAGHL